jgi:hypothetical protein
MRKQIIKLALLVGGAVSLWHCGSDPIQASCGESLPLYNVRDAGADVNPSDSAAFRANVEAGCVTAPVPPPAI